MKRIVLNVITCAAGFAFGIAASSILTGSGSSVVNKRPPENLTVRCSPQINQPTPVPLPAPVASSDRELVIGEGDLRVVIEQVQLKSQRLQYDVDVSYPQIIGSDDLHIRRLNQRIRDLATDAYQWTLTPSLTDLRYYRRQWPEAFNAVHLDYEVLSATDRFLSIYFDVSSYGIGAGTGVQYSFALNYDFTLRKELTLSDIFRRRSNYLEYISRYSLNEFSRKSEFLFKEALTPRARNFKSWNVTRDGIRFNFDECAVFACAEGAQTVVIPFADLQPLLNRNAF